MRLPFRLIAGLAGIASAMGVAEAGYLSTVGPAPLRFASPRAATAKAALPPLPGDQATAQPPMPAAAAESGPFVVSTQSPFPVQPLGLGLSLTTADKIAVTPQELVQLVRRNSENKDKQDTTTVVPISFVPPSPPPHPSSTATYEIR